MPLVLYSAVSRLAYLINQRHYGGIHYVWCAPNMATDRFEPTNPPSSDPLDLCARFQRDSQRNDGHSDLITANRAGIVRGAIAREAQGRITRATRARIEQMAFDAHCGEFVPLLMVIPFQPVVELVREVDGTDMAGATSQEYIIEELPRAMFDVIRWGDRA